MYSILLLLQNGIVIAIMFVLDYSCSAKLYRRRDLCVTRGCVIDYDKYLCKSFGRQCFDLWDRVWQEMPIDIGTEYTAGAYRFDRICQEASFNE